MSAVALCFDVVFHVELIPDFFSFVISLFELPTFQLLDNVFGYYWAMSQLVLEGLTFLGMERDLCMLDNIGYFWTLYIFSYTIVINVLNLVASIVLDKVKCQEDEWHKYNSCDS